MLSKNDKVLIGLLNLCDRIFSYNPKLKELVGQREKDNFVMEVFARCLFDIEEQEDLNEENIKFYDTNIVKCKNE